MQGASRLELIRFGLSVSILLLVLGVAGCSSGEAEPTAGAGHGSAAASPASQGADGAEGAEDEDDSASIAVRVGEVLREPLSSLYTTSATLRAHKQATVTARTNGVLETILVEEGDRVEVGQPLAVLENAEQTIEFEKATTVRDTTLREFERASELHQQGLLSQEEFEASRRAAEEAKHVSELAELMLSRTVIRATFDGTILRRHLDVGGVVNDGTAVYDLADLTPLYADVNIPERQIAALSPGQQVRLHSDFANLAADALIERIAPSVDAETGTVKVTLAVPEQHGMRPGSFVNVQIVTDTHARALVVPRSALVAEGRRWHLFRLKDDGPTVERVEIERGFEEGNRVEVTSVGGTAQPLNAGDRIVVVGASALSEGARVRVMEPEPAQSASEVRGDVEGPGEAA